MSTQLKPIKVWGQGGPNPPKVAFVLEELGLPHEIVPIGFDKIKEPEYLKINPNGRIPSIYDPNTDLTLWESGAIIEYLTERYDTKHQISFAQGTSEYYHAKQWLFFQTSGQGPYCGQAMWFNKYHSEKLPSAIQRYVKESIRVCAVLDGWLSQQKQKHGSSGDGPWLVGDKLSYADLSFVPWQKVMARSFSKDDGYDLDAFPNLREWLEKLEKRESVVKVWDAAMKSMGRA